MPSPTEAVWEIVEHGWVFIAVRPAHSGHAMHTAFVDDLDAWAEGIADRGFEPAEREAYARGGR